MSDINLLMPYKISDEKLAAIVIFLYLSSLYSLAAFLTSVLL